MSTPRPERRFLRAALQGIPHGAHEGWNRYDTDDEHVLSLWADGQTWDLRVTRMDRRNERPFIGATLAEPAEPGVVEPDWLKLHAEGMGGRHDRRS